MIPQEEMHWLYIPGRASDLATTEDYSYLSGQLIQAGVVNASDCPLNGLWPNGYANACGLERTRAASLYLQNAYDEQILAAGKSIGVPPVMIKQLIRYESQFWPISMDAYHFGLAHLTYAGAVNALFWNRDLLEATMAQSASLYDLPSRLLSMMDASCVNCEYKIDVSKAQRSIVYIAETLLGYCQQTSLVIHNATGTSAGYVVDYPTIWKLTLLNYNAGPYCVYNAVKAGYHYDSMLDWYQIADQISDQYCLRGVNYVDNITGNYYDFGTSP